MDFTPIEYKGYLITETEKGFVTDVPGCRNEYFETIEQAYKEIEADIASNAGADAFEEKYMDMGY